MKADSTKTAKNQGKLLDQATDQLLQAIKQKMMKKDGRVDYEKLRQEGYSERILARLEQA